MQGGEVDTFTVSTSERFIDPGTVYELPVPLSDPSGGFLVYSWEEKSGEAVRFTVRTDAGRTILDEVQVRSASRLGFLDLRVNAKRLNWISADLRAKGWTAPAISKAEYPDYFDMLPFTFDDYVKSVLTPDECVSPGNLCQ